MATNAIETEYAGHLFRSRLEARWAVFFDAIELPWRYENEGFESGGARYLPDFHLPTLGVWCEVKGDPDGLRKDAARLSKILTGEGAPTPLLILGELPRVGGLVFHPMLEPVEGYGLTRSWRCFMAAKGKGTYLIGPAGPNVFIEPTSSFLTLTGLSLRTRIEETPDDPDDWEVGSRLLHSPNYYFPFVDAAYDAARKARFEHGQSGAFAARQL